MDMSHITEGQAPQLTFRTLRILWGAMLFTNVLYAVVLILVLQQPPAEEPADMTPILVMFVALSLLTFPMAYLLRHLLIFKRLGKGDTAPGAAMATIFTGSIVSFALFESISLYGFVLAFLSQDILYYVPFAVLGVIGLISVFPRGSLLELALHSKKDDANPAKKALPGKPRRAPPLPARSSSRCPCTTSTQTR